MVRGFKANLHQGCNNFLPFNRVQCTAVALVALLTFVSIPDVLRNPQVRIQKIFPVGGSKRWNLRPKNSLSKKKGRQRARGSFMLIALYFFNFSIVLEHWGRLEGRGVWGPSPRKIWVTHFPAKNTTIDTKHCHRASADPEGGATGGPDPPLDLSELGSCVGRGVGSMVIFTSFFARQYYTNILHVYILPWSMFSMERSSFLYISLIQITSHPCFYERAFTYFSCLELQDFTPL